MSEETTHSEDSSRLLARTVDIGSAEHLQLLLMLNDIRAVILQGDALAAVTLACDILVMSADHARAAAVLRELQLAAHQEDWDCPACHEENPGQFDLCWNCGELQEREAVPLDQLHEAAT